MNEQTMDVLQLFPFTDSERGAMFELIKDFLVKELRDDICDGVAMQLSRITRASFRLLDEKERYIYLDTIIKTYVEFSDTTLDINDGDRTMCGLCKLNGPRTMLNLIELIEGNVQKEHIKLFVCLTD